MTRGSRGSRGGRLRNDAVAITDECSPCQYPPTRDLRTAEAAAGMSVLCFGSSHVWKGRGREGAGIFDFLLPVSWQCLRMFSGMGEGEV